MKIFFVTLIMVAFSYANAQEFLESSKIEADLRCEQPGGSVAVALPGPGKPARVWQTDPGSDEGLEIQLTAFRVARCQGCFSFTGLLFGMQVKGDAVDSKLTYSLYNEELNQFEILLENVECVTARK